ncbi:MAG: 50S ribosomal protein L10 [Anaplasmataceae bacterium]|nr:50S ribosomal protein L10 [Anaplasmataceae bacterium]
MKTKVQKQAEIKEGQELLSKSKSLVYANFSGMSAENLRQLRRTLTQNGSKFFVTKKRLLALVLKEKGIDFDTKENAGSVGTVFSSMSPEEVSAIVFKFLKGTGSKKGEEMVGGYDIEGKLALTAEDIRALGQLPPREVLLAQIMGLMVASLKSFMYILQEKSKQGGGDVKSSEAKIEDAPASEVKTEAPTPETPTVTESPTAESTGSTEKEEGAG